LNREARAAAIQRFLYKRQRRVWGRNIRYNCRKNLADTRVRVNGRFIRAQEGVNAEMPVDVDTGSVFHGVSIDAGSGAGLFFLTRPQSQDDRANDDEEGMEVNVDGSDEEEYEVDVDGDVHVDVVDTAVTSSSSMVE
jgi:hypothetical protein